MEQIRSFAVGVVGAVAGVAAAAELVLVVVAHVAATDAVCRYTCFYCESAIPNTANSTT